jgi:hypothetical protein
MLHLAALRPTAVKADDVAALVLQRHDDAAVEVLVAAAAPQAKLREPRPQRLAFVAIALRQAQAERAVGEADSQPSHNGKKLTISFRFPKEH